MSDTHSTPCANPQHKKSPQHVCKKRPVRSPYSVLVPVAGSFKLSARKLVYTQTPRDDPAPLDLGLPVKPAPGQANIDQMHAAREAFYTLCMQTD